MNYENYDEYIGEQQDINYHHFLYNINLIGERKEKIKVFRGFSNTEVPKMPDNFFDIIYIDANHLKEFVLEDAVLAFRKLKKDGVMIFDDYPNPETKMGIDAFLSIYESRITIIGYNEDQCFIIKTKDM